MKNEISQTEARRLRKRVAYLEGVLTGERRRYSSDWPGGVLLATVNLPPDTSASVRTARMLGHAVVVTADGQLVKVYALPHPAVKP